MEIIAERRLEIELPGEVDRKTIRVLMGRPEARDGEIWVVSYEIQGPGTDEVVKRELYGADSMQALECALHMLPLELEAYARRGRVTVDGQAGSGFRSSPEAKSIGE